MRWLAIRAAAILSPLVMGVCAGPVSAAPVLARSPSASATAIAFVARGDLWIAARDGGPARRLVRSAGHVVAERFSPDGRWIAYTERAHGGQDVYAIPAAGGVPRRLTFDALPQSEDNLAVAWTPDSRRIVFLSDRTAWADKVSQAFSVPVEGGEIRAMPLDQSGLLSFSADGRSIAYTRTFTGFASRKRYTGGRAEDIYTYDLTQHHLTRVTDWKGTDTAPLWWGRRIYFLSDRGPGFRMNLWCYDLDAHTFHPVTRFADYDVDWPALGPDRIVFQRGGKLWAVDLPGERLHEITVEVPDDGARTAPRILDVSREARRSDVTGTVDYALSPDGTLAILAAHGDLFSVELPTGVARNLTATPAVDEDHPALSPDGRTLAYITEADGAQQVAVRPLQGGPARQLTHFASAVLYTPLFCPDGRWLAVASAEHELWLLDLQGGAPRRVNLDPAAEIRDAAFSGDGRWLAYSTVRATGLSALHVHGVLSGEDRMVSSALESDRLPAFAPDGHALYFVSTRHELPFTTDRGDEASLSTLESDGLYAVPFDGARLDGLMSRAIALPVPPGRIVSLEAHGADLIYETRPPALINGELPGTVAALHALSMPSGMDRVLVSDLDLHVLSADARHVLWVRNRAWRLVDLVSGRDQAITLPGLALTEDPRAQWQEMLEHAWRLDRDLFFSRAMNGSRWDEVHEAYARLLPGLGSRDDFLYVLSQLQGELATSHAFIGGLDADDASPPVRTPRLGADLALDTARGRYRITRIYAGDPTRARFRSPLNAPSLGGSPAPAQAGEYLLAINGRELKAPADPDSLLLGVSGDVELTLAPRPESLRRTLKVTPVADDRDLRQYAWVEANRERVERLSAGRVGYLFLSDFEAAGSEDLFRQLQGQLDKDGLVIDVRWNQGGFTSQAVLNLLKRVRASGFVNREGAVTPLPLLAAPRAMAAVVNAQTASDGDQFAYFFRAFGLGPIVGERTWGGVQGIKGPWPLMDGTRITIPKDSLASPDGHWLIENAGVEPDIPVAREPDEQVRGSDRQLEAAVQAVLQQLKDHPPAPLRAPAPLPAYPPAGDVPGARFGPSG